MASDQSLPLVSGSIEHISASALKRRASAKDVSCFDKTSSFIFGAALGMFVTLHLVQLYTDTVEQHMPKIALRQIADSWAQYRN